jgi:hypothetical protein
LTHHRPPRSAAAATTTIAVDAASIEVTPGARASSTACHTRPGSGNASVPNPGVAAAGTGAPSTEVVDAIPLLRTTPRAPTTWICTWSKLLQRLLTGSSPTPAPSSRRGLFAPG